MHVTNFSVMARQEPATLNAFLEMLAEWLYVRCHIRFSFVFAWLSETNDLDCFRNGQEAHFIYAELRLSRLAHLATFLLPSSKGWPLDLVQCCDLRTSREYRRLHEQPTIRMCGTATFPAC